MEWIADPNAWIGLATLVVLEIVLGIDNLVFIAILAEKLPPGERERARLIGLSLALGMRLVLLASISWIVTLTSPLFSLGSLSVSGRDLILIVGGVFLIAKGTMELHERLEEHETKTGGPRTDAVFWQVIAQIVVLDAVFSLDSVITAVGMVEHFMVMVIAVIVAMAIMMLASKPLMAFVNRHPTVVILCLGFLLMIGFSLVVEGFGYHVPKGYLYAAIGFSVLIEAVNQIRGRKTDSEFAGLDMRGRTAARVLKLLGRRKRGTGQGQTATVAPEDAEPAVFAPVETDMIQGVLSLAGRPVRTIMSPRNEIQWIDLGDTQGELRAEILKLTHSTVLLCRDGLDGFVGVAATTDLLHMLAEGAVVDLASKMRQPLVVHEKTNVLKLLEDLRRSSIPLSIVLDEYGSVVGVATPTDILEAIAGEFPDHDETPAEVIRDEEDGTWTFDGFVDVHRASSVLGVDLVDPSHRYTTLNGFVISTLGDIPEPGQRLKDKGLEFEILSMKGRTVDKLRVREGADGDAATARP